MLYKDFHYAVIILLNVITLSLIVLSVEKFNVVVVKVVAPDIKRNPGVAGPQRVECGLM
jgi:hypothetical protein